MSTGKNNYQILIKNMPDAFAYHQIILDDNNEPVDYLFLEINDAFEEMTEKKSVDVIGKKVTEVYPDIKNLTLDWISSYGQVATSGKNIRFESYFEPAGRWYDIRAYSDKPGYFAVIFRDITDHKLSQKALKQIEWMLNPEHTVAAGTKKDTSKQPYGNLSVLNQARLIMDSVDPNVLHDTANDYLHLLETSTAIYEKNGDYALGLFTSGWCKALDNASRSLCNTDDNLTALQSGKWHCHESCWLDASKVAIESGEPTDIECAGGIRLYTVPIKADNQVVGSINIGYGSPPQDLDKLKEIAEKYQIDIDELTTLAKTYEERPPFIISLAKDRLHSSARLIGALVERRKREMELSALNEELEQRIHDRTAQLEAANLELEAFAYSVSHDLRTPLRSMDGYSKLLLSTYEDQLDEEGKHYLGRIRVNSQNMGELIDGMLILSRVTRSDINFEQVDISELADEVISKLREIEPNHKADIIIAPRLTARFDSRLMRIILENLLGNAWKFSAQQAQPIIEFGSTEQNGLTTYFVRDNGVGFDMNYADKLFLAFQRLHNIGEFAGTGIGLATVQRAINRFGGQIWAESEVGKGSTFYFTLGRGSSGE